MAPNFIAQTYRVIPLEPDEYLTGDRPMFPQAKSHSNATGGVHFSVKNAEELERIFESSRNRSHYTGY